MRAFKAGCLGAIPPAFPHDCWQVLGTTVGIFFNSYRNKYFLPQLDFIYGSCFGRQRGWGGKGAVISFSSEDQSWGCHLYWGDAGDKSCYCSGSLGKEGKNVTPVEGPVCLHGDPPEHVLLFQTYKALESPGTDFPAPVTSHYTSCSPPMALD